MTTVTMTFNMKSVIAQETAARHLVNLIKSVAATDDWASKLAGKLFIDETENMPESWVTPQSSISTGRSNILVYERMSRAGFLGFGGNPRKNEIILTIDLVSGTKADYVKLKYLIRKLCQDNNSTHATMVTDDGQYRWRIILNNENNISDTYQKIWRNTFEVQMNTWTN